MGVLGVVWISKSGLHCHFWYPQNGGNGIFLPFWGYQKWHFGCPNQNSETTFRDPNLPQNPHLYILGTFFSPRKVIFGRFVNFAYFYLVFPLARAVFFQMPRTLISGNKMQPGTVMCFLKFYTLVFLDPPTKHCCHILLDFFALKDLFHFLSLV